MKMNYHIFVFLALSLKSFQDGGSMASPTSTGSTSTEDTRTCPMSTELPTNNEVARHSRLADTAMECMKGSQSMEQLNVMTKLDEFQQFFNSYCQEATERSLCLNGVESLAEQCLNHTHNMIIQIQKGMLQTFLDVGCTNNGDILSQLLFGLNSFEGEDIVDTCINEVVNKDISLANTPSKSMMALFKGMNEFKACIVGKLGDHNEDLKMMVASFIDNVKTEMLCIHPQNDVVVKCSSIENDKK